MKVAPDEPGLLDRIGGALEGIGEFLGDVIEFVKDNWWDILHKLVNLAATVLSIASIFLGRKASLNIARICLWLGSSRPASVGAGSQHLVS